MRPDKLTKNSTNNPQLRVNAQKTQKILPDKWLKLYFFRGWLSYMFVK